MGLSGPALYRYVSGRDELIHLAEHRQWVGCHPADPAALRRALTFRTRLHGVLSPEPAGRFTGMGFGPAPLHGTEPAGLTHVVP
ncbi:hypothetical protein ACIF9R_31420 [Streptomyces sp. NPDC086080]|uniref:hypothetical protein n=1 Tax=Streptomyces sp. NPDC086080 TaxID=3365748 RepID=UPI0037CD9509